MSDTVVCRDANLERDVVVKAIKPGTDEKHLLGELAALQSIRSKYVVQVYDVIRDPTSGNVLGIVEEYIGGDQLTPLSVGCTEVRILQALYPIAAGITEVHAHGLIHRDLKPDNMKFDHDGNLRIFDFGLSKASTAAGTKQLFFSEGFTAPEAFVKDSSGLYQFSSSLDIFAFGMTAFWLMNAGAIPAALKGIAPVVPCSELDFSKCVVSINGELGLLLQACVDVDPVVRPRMQEVSTVIKNHLLKDRHRLLIVFEGQEYLIDKDNRVVTFRWPNAQPTAEVTIQYNGLNFIAHSVKGPVAVNNGPIVDGFKFSGAAVIVLGSDALAGGRASVTADLSHPEVTL